MALRRLYEERRARHEEEGEPKLTWAAVQRGTSTNRNSWGTFAKGRRPMRLHHILEAAIFFGVRPQDHFPSWEYSKATLRAPPREHGRKKVPPDERIERASRLLLMLDDAARNDALALLHHFVHGTKALRAKMMRIARTDSPVRAKLTLAKTA